jgi:hypothetical protein
MLLNEKSSRKTEMEDTMRKLVLVLLVIALLASTGSAHGAPPANGPNGLATALAAQERHNPALLAIPGVVGTAVGLGEDGTAEVRVFTEKPRVGRIPAFLDGTPVVVQVTGSLSALKVRPPRNTAPTVSIIEPEDGAPFDSGDTVSFQAVATDARGRDLSSQVEWTSSLDGFLFTGAEFSRGLSDGTHVITASATDSRGKTGKDTVTVTVGGTTAQKDTTDVWDRPVPIGVSTGNSGDISAGTIACRVVDASGNQYALSNTHVYAPNDIDGQSEIGDIVTQPGLYDVATHEYDPSLLLGTLSAYKPINGSIFAFNDIDAAIALTNTPELGTMLGNSTPTTLGGYGIPNTITRAAELNLAVQKFGRTTQLTKGTITGINGTFAINYAPDWYAWFTGQIVAESSAAFILPGDSGSLMVTDDAGANPVGLLFAGNADGTMSIANPIDAVLEYFHVTIDYR